MMQNTHSPKKTDVKQAWFHIDASGKVLGKIATTVADLIRGKHKTYFAPHVDCGDFVIITNAEKVVLTGKKMTSKLYYSHSRHFGHLKSISAQ